MASRKPVKKRFIVIHLQDVGRNLHYAKKKSIGATLRLIDGGNAQMLRILPRSV